MTFVAAWARHSVGRFPGSLGTGGQDRVLVRSSSRPHGSPSGSLARRGLAASSTRGLTPGAPACHPAAPPAKGYTHFHNLYGYAVGGAGRRSKDRAFVFAVYPLCGMRPSKCHRPLGSGTGLNRSGRRMRCMTKCACTSEVCAYQTCSFCNLGLRSVLKSSVWKNGSSPGEL